MALDSIGDHSFLCSPRIATEEIVISNRISSIVYMDNICRYEILTNGGVPYKEHDQATNERSNILLELTMNASYKFIS
jgi:hypothetical protein